MSVLLYGCTTCSLTKRLEKKVSWELYKDIACCFEQIQEAAPYKKALVQPFTYHPTSHQIKNMQDMPGSTGEVMTNSWVKFSNELQHKTILIMADQQKFIFISNVRTVDVV